MAYMNAQRKAALAPGIKAVLAKYGMKGSISGAGTGTLRVKVVSGPLNIISNYNEELAKRSIGRYPPPAFQEGSLDVNPYWYREHFTGQVLAFISELIEAMDVGNHDRSDLQTDYHDVGWYKDIDIGSYRKPYIYQEPAFEPIDLKPQFDALMDQAVVSHKAELARAEWERS